MSETRRGGGREEVIGTGERGAEEESRREEALATFRQLLGLLDSVEIEKYKSEFEGRM